ncbi:MAG: hypothetical protein R6U32_02400 [Candidatus Woesearchaeota archaeon]
MEGDEEGVDLSNLDQKIKDQPYNDETLKKRIRKTRIFAGVSVVAIILILAALFLLRFYAGAKTGNFSMMKITPLFYALIGGSALMIIILTISFIIILQSHRRLSTYNRKIFIMRVAAYATIIIILSLFFFTELPYYIGITEHSSSEYYSAFQKYDEVFIPSMQNITELTSRGNKAFSAFQRLNQDYTAHKNITFEEYNRKAEEKLNISLESFTGVARLSGNLAENDLPDSEFFPSSTNYSELSSVASKKANLTRVYQSLLEANQKAEKTSREGDREAYDEAMARIDELAEKEKRLQSELNEMQAMEFEKTRS